MIIKITFAALLFLLSCKAITASPQAERKDKYVLTKIAENTWKIQAADPKNSSIYLIEGKKKALLIDTGLDCEKLDSVVNQITNKPLSVVITHLHEDHVGSMHLFKNVYIPKGDTALFRIKKIKANPGKTNFVDDGDVFDLGGVKVEVARMPGHTPGSIVLLDTQSGNCYTGDAFGAGFVYLQIFPITPIATYITSCKRMQKFMDHGITRIYSGHCLGKPLDRSYIDNMRLLAEDFSNGVAPEGKPFFLKIGCANPLLIRKGNAIIVYDPDSKQDYFLTQLQSK